MATTLQKIALLAILGLSTAERLVPQTQQAIDDRITSLPGINVSALPFNMYRSVDVLVNCVTELSQRLLDG